MQKLSPNRSSLCIGRRVTRRNKRSEGNCDVRVIRTLIEVEEMVFGSEDSW